MTNKNLKIIRRSLSEMKANLNSKNSLILHFAFCIRGEAVGGCIFLLF